MSPKRFRAIIWAVVIVAVAVLGAYGYSVNRCSALDAHYMDAAEHAEHTGDFAGAQRYYERALAVDPRFLPARIGLADIYETQGYSEKSLGEYRRAVALDPRNPEAHAALAHELMSRQRYPEAVRCLERGVKVAPKDAHMHLMLTSCYRLTGEYEKARKSLAAYGRLAPRSTATANALRSIARESQQEPPASARATAPTKGAAK
jgi:tetratricopeptide (TPR) repeat protein